MKINYQSIGQQWFRNITVINIIYFPMFSRHIEHANPPTIHAEMKYDLQNGRERINSLVFYM